MKIGKYLFILAGLFFVLITLLTVFEDQLFSKDGARKVLAEQSIYLTDKLEIIENKSMSGIGDCYHTFTLNISQRDKARLVNEIIRSKKNNFDKETISYFDNREDYYNGSRRIKNCVNENQFVRELFEPQGKGYAPIWRKIEIMKTKIN